MRHEDGDLGAHREHDRAIRPHLSARARRCDRQHDLQPRQGRGNGMSELTHVELTWLKKRIENWIRFGRTVVQRLRHYRVSYRYPARRSTRRTLLDRAICASWRREPAPPQ